MVVAIRKSLCRLEVDIIVQDSASVVVRSAVLGACGCGCVLGGGICIGIGSSSCGAGAVPLALVVS